jgi:hypothetical protein
VLAEAGLQLQRHQQLTPFASQGLPLAHLLGVEAACQLLGEGAAPFHHPSADKVGHKGPDRADRVDTWMPPEAIVLAGEQGIDQHRRVIVQPGELVVVLILGGGDRPVGAVVEEQRTAHGCQTAADRHLHHRGAQQQQAAARERGECHAPEPEKFASARVVAMVEPKRRQVRIIPVTVRRVGAETNPISVVQQQLPHALTPPPEPIGGSEIAEQPVVAMALQQSMAAADGGMVDDDVVSAVATDPVTAAVQRQFPAWQG